MRLREVRRDCGLSGRALAAATGWHFTRILRSRTAPDDGATLHSLLQHADAALYATKSSGR
jgi:hypothetical protein